MEHVFVEHGKHERVFVEHVFVEHVHRAAIHHMERQAAGRGIANGCESRAEKHHVLRQCSEEVDRHVGRH